MHRSLLLLLLAFGSAAHAACSSPRPIDLAPFAAEIGTRKLVFLAQDTASDTCWSNDASALDQRHPPWSTFKLPHVLVALETGVLRSLADAVEWDGAKFPAQPYWPKDWAQRQTLVTAFERSTAWYFQSLVPHVGASNYQRWLDRFGYGNRVVPPDGDDFWLDGSLRVSVREQVEFLACLATTGCGTSRHSVQLLERLAQQDSAGPRRLYGKTGSGPLRRGDFDGPFGGWFVGYVRGANAQAPVVFALYAEGESFSSLRSFRRQMAMRLLTQIQAWPS